ncbi:hypothetical protein BDV93DRAFT_604711 [Ceratobasidium sp. AG-I]|nr:hypothetical protein BDV93DRAFT_604711 [Ceratobasidium sp. AG-I]
MEFRDLNPRHNMSFPEIMNRVGGRGSYSRAIQSVEGRASLLAILGVSFDDIPRLARLGAVTSLLQNVAENGNVDNLREAIQNARDQPSSDQSIEPPPLENSLGDSFTQAYSGTAVDGLYKFLEKCNQSYTNKHYAKFCSIAQSSGTGKTRTIVELKTKGVMVLYMNIRDSDDDNSFPLRDEVPARILTKDLNYNQEDYSDRCMAFFTAIFNTVAYALHSYPKPKSADQVIEHWNGQMCEMGSSARVTFFKKIKKNYQNALVLIQKERQAMLDLEAENAKDTRGTDNIVDVQMDEQQMNEQQMDTTQETVGTEDHEMREGQGVVPSSSHNTVDTQSSDQSRSRTKPELPGAKQMSSAYQELLAAFPNVFDRSSNHPKLVIAFDEAHTLSNVQGSGYRPADALCRAISLYSRSDVSNWVIFASTVSQVADFSAPAHIYDSYRVVEGGELLFPPYTYLGWDQMAKPLRNINPWEAARFGNIVAFGRPLWASYVNATIEKIISLACIKLCKNIAFNPYKKAHALAVLGQRFGLDISFGHPDAVSYLQKAVASHLRICRETTVDRIWQYTLYPSEPLLSYAAAKLLHENPTHLHDALRCLQRTIQGGLIDMGQKGELTSRLLLLLAKDLCVRSTPDLNRELGVRWEVELRDCKRVPVIDFLVFLFGEHVLVGDARKQFEHWHVNFSHWVSMSKWLKFRSIDHESEWTLRHWCRTSAVQGCHNQPKIDKVIPMYYYDLESSQTEPYRLSHILVSDRARDVHSQSDLSSITATMIGFSTNEPYIVMLLDLRITNKSTESTMDSDKSCLRIYAPGVTASTYPRLDPEVLKILSDTLDVPKRFEKDPDTGFLRGQVDFGSTVEDEHMNWEEGRQGLAQV